MTDRLEAALLAQIAGLQRRLDLIRDSSTDSSHMAVDDLLDLNSLLTDLEHDLLNPVYAIISNAEIIASLAKLADRRDIASSTKRAARILECNLVRLLDLSHVSMNQFDLCPQDNSLRSITHQAVLLLSDIHQENRSIRFDAVFESTDWIVAADGQRVVHLLVSALQSALLSLQDCTVSLTQHNERQGDQVTASWYISIDSPLTDQDWRQALDLPTEDGPLLGRASLGVLYTRALSEVLGADIVIGDVPYGLQVTLQLPVVHNVDQAPPDLLTRNTWVDSTILVSREPPNLFTPLRASMTLIPPEADIPTYLQETNAELLILHQTGEGGDDEFERNLQICRQSRLPVLLRASALTYDQFNRYKDKLDAILMEPSEEGDLARYIVGLTRPNRRSSRRQADIY
jgi:hypothetical protein